MFKLKDKLAEVKDCSIAYAAIVVWSAKPSYISEGKTEDKIKYKNTRRDGNIISTLWLMWSSCLMTILYKYYITIYHFEVAFVFITFAWNWIICWLH